MEHDRGGWVIAKEFEGARLGDARRTRRLIETAEHVVAAADRTLPEKLAAPGALQGAYRFLRNPRVHAEAILAPHVAQTVRRARACPVVLAVHDTTECRFGGRAPRPGLGVLSDHGQGFHAHVTLAVTPAGEPLGVLNLWAWRRAPWTAPSMERARLRPRAAPQSITRYDPGREYVRWFEGVDATAARLADHPRVVHVMDREGDCTELIAQLLDEGRAFIIRLCHDRRLDAHRRAVGVAKLYEALAGEPVRYTCDVAFGARAPATDHGHRSARRATLAVRAGAFVISPSNNTVYHVPPRLPVHVVEVREVDPPAGEEPILWRLVTTEPIATDADVTAVITAYRARWGIEEYFKIVKTGCRYEALQLRTGRALLNALCLVLPVAWSLLRLRWWERDAPEAAATHVLTPMQLDVLARQSRRRAMPRAEPPTVREALWAIAALGGHIRHNGPPGVLTLLRGFHTLTRMEAAVLAFREPTPPKM
jgi:hypothetical protein